MNTTSKNLYLTPIEYIKHVFERKDIVFLSEDHAVKENLDFVKELIPHLYEVGVDYLGMEFGAQEDQNELDKLVTGDQYNTQKARDLMFNYNVIFPYKEYMDLYKAVFDFNQTLGPSEKKFRLLNISYVYDWSKFNPPYTEENKVAVFHRGEIETFRKDIIVEEVINKNKKILILTGTYHAFTKVRFKSTDNMAFGQQVYDLVPDKTYTIHFHEKSYDMKGNRILPCGGKLEDYLNKYDSPCGFDLEDNPIGDYPIEGEEKIEDGIETLRELFDGYIYLKPLEERSGCTVDYHYLDGRDFQDVLDQFPDPHWHEPITNVKEYWKMVERFVDLKSR